MAAEQAARFGRPAPAITTSVMVALDGDPTVPGRDAIISLLSDPDGMFGVPAAQAPDAYLPGGPAALAGHLGRLAEAGAHRTVIQFVAATGPAKPTWPPKPGHNPRPAPAFLRCGSEVSRIH